MSKLFSEFPELVSDLEQVKLEINNQITTDEVSFNNHVKRYFNDNAKLLRPGFVLIAASYKNNYRNNEHIKCAAAAEMLHVASLIHDDIIDKSKTRRGITTLNSEFDNGYAVICGDFLYAKSFEIMFSNVSLSAIKSVGSGVVNMAVGEAYQYLEKYNYNLDIDRYLEIIAKKSATLFQTNLITGAKLANLSKKEEDLLITFGYEFGMMFQIQDDILDYLNDEMFKPIHSDLKRGIYTLPVIIAADKSDEFRQYLNNNEIDFEIVLNYLEATDAICLATQVAEQYYHRCCSAINNLSNPKVQKYLQHLTDLTYRRIK